MVAIVPQKKLKFLHFHPKEAALLSGFEVLFFLLFLVVPVKYSYLFLQN
jgi:hypothetical protein